MIEKKCLNPKCDRLTYAAYCCGICRAIQKGAKVLIAPLHTEYCDREIAPRTGEKK